MRKWSNTEEKKKVSRVYGILQAIPEGRKERYYTRVVLLGNECGNCGQASGGSYEVPGQRPMKVNNGACCSSYMAAAGRPWVIPGVSEA